MNPIDSSTHPVPVPAAAPGAREGDAALRDDIRLLGRLLGDTLREQEGAEAMARR